MIGLGLKLLGFLSGGTFNKLLEAVLGYMAKKGDRELEGFKTAAGIDLEATKAYLNAQIENNRLKLAQQSWWGAKLIILIAGVTSALHFGLIMLDSSCPATWGWNIVNGKARGGCGFGFTALPAPYDTYQWAIVQSFFLVMPTMTVANAVATWLGRKR